MVRSLVILLTGFGPFMGVPDNPTGRIATRLKDSIHKLCGTDKTLTSIVLKVTPGIIEAAPIKDKEVILSFGVAAGSREVRIERASRNIYYDSITNKSTPIDPSRPLGEVQWGSFVPTTLEGESHGFKVILGDETSAGDYVCNDTYYRATRTGKRAYFIHIPNISHEEDNSMIALLSEISCTLLEN